MKKEPPKTTPSRTAGRNAPGKPAGTRKPPLPVRTSLKANLYFILSFFVLAFVLYGNTIFNGYSVDDTLVTNNPVIQKGVAAFPEIFTTRYFLQEGNTGTTASDYRPIVKATFALEYQLWGQKPGRSHIINILLYWGAALLLFFNLKRLLRNFNILFPFLITVLFMAHPVHTEVVASLKNRDELLAFLCGMGSLHFFIKYASSRRLWHATAGALLFFAGYFCKSSILPFLFLIPLSLYFFTDMPAKKLWPVFGIMLVLFITAQMAPNLFLPKIDRIRFYIENPLYFEKDLWTRLGTGMVTLLFYLRLLVWPHPLLYYYGYDMIPVTGLLNGWALLSLLLNGALLAYALFTIRQRKFLSFAILWYFFAIAMYSNILLPVVGIVGERFIFTASLGFCMALVWIIFKVFRTEPRSLTIELDARIKILGVMALILIPATVLSISRNNDWNSVYSLYRHDIPSLGRSAKANIDYATFLKESFLRDPNFINNQGVNQHKFDQMVTHYRRALTIYPDNYVTTNDLGTVYLFFGKHLDTLYVDSAILYIRKALEIDPTHRPAWVNLGIAYMERKDYPGAIASFEQVLKIDPNEVRAIFKLADIYNLQGDFEKAVKMNEEVMKKYPGLEMPYVNIGNYYMMQRDTLRAVGYWEKAASIRPTFELCVQLNSYYLSVRNEEKAAYYYRIGEQLARGGR